MQPSSFAAPAFHSHLGTSSRNRDAGKTAAPVPVEIAGRGQFNLAWMRSLVSGQGDGMAALRVFPATDESQSNHRTWKLLITPRAQRHRASRPHRTFSPAECWPRTRCNERPTANVRPANNSTVIRWPGGAVSSRNRLNNPIHEMVRLRKRNTGTVKSGESFNSWATSIGVLRFLKSRARATVSPDRRACSRKKSRTMLG